jgi:hypothetical protein
MERNTMIRRLRAVALMAAVAPLFAACGSMVDNETMGAAPTSLPTDNANVSFIRYAALGTSLGAGIESGGINDSTQREAYTYQLAMAMGLTPGVNWFYPSLTYPGCPAPYTNILTGARVNGASAAFCGLRAPGSAHAYMSNVSIPSLRAAQAIDLTAIPFGPTDTLKLAQFITGGVNPLTMVMQQGATFVTVEVVANDVLGAGTRGDTLLLTSTASLQASLTTIADSLDLLGAAVAMANAPRVTRSPHFTRASTLWAIKNVQCPGLPAAVQATIPYCSPLFAPSATCAPAIAGGLGDSYVLPFATTGAVTSTLAAARAASITCGPRDSVLVAIAGPPAVPSVSPGVSINTAEFPVMDARVTAFNSAILTLANARGYAHVDMDAALGAIPVCAAPGAANCVPPVPNFTAPTFLMGTYFSQDGLHPSKAGYRLTAQTFATAINAKYGTSLTIP